MKRSAFLCGVALSCMLMGCASSYRPILVKNTNYTAAAEIDGVKMQYRYNALKQAGNKKYSKKELRSPVRVIAVEFTNNTDRPINFGKDIEIYSATGRLLTPVQPESVKKYIRQVSGLYMIWGIFWITITKCDDKNGYDDDCSYTPLPVGLVIGLANMGAASGANKSFAADLMRHNLLNKTIEPGRTVQGVITVSVETDQTLELRLKK